MFLNGTINSRTDASQNSAVILAQIAMPDGFTSVADIDPDGDPDAIVTGEAISTVTAATMPLTNLQAGLMREDVELLNFIPTFGVEN